MDNNKIINLNVNAVNKNDVINKGQLDEFKNELNDRYRFLLKIIHSWIYSHILCLISMNQANS